MPVQISAVIITYNEQSQLGKCLESIRGIADEVIVLDSFSTDRTREIAIDYGAVFTQHVFDGHIEQKNRARLLATHEWVLSLDADEALSDELRTNLLALKQHPEADGYRFNRLNFYCGRPIKSCGWYPDSKLRLWKKHMGAWGGQNPHDRFEMQKEAKIIHLKGDILHNTYPGPEDLKRQTLNFAKISAGYLKEKNAGVLVLKCIFGPLFKFIKSYFIKKGILDGRDGFVISKYQALEVFYKYFFALRNKAKGC